MRVHFRVRHRSKLQISAMAPAVRYAPRCGAAKAAVRCTGAACACRLAAVPVGPHRRCGGTSVATHPNVWMLQWMHESPVSARSDSSGDVASNRKRSPAAAVPCARTCAQWYVSHNHRIACGRRSDTRPFQSSSANPTAEYISRAQTTRLQQRLAHSGKRSVTVACLVTLLISCDMGIFGTRCAHV
jgi:hypothetical protein